MTPLRTATALLAATLTITGSTTPAAPTADPGGSPAPPPTVATAPAGARPDGVVTWASSAQQLGDVAGGQTFRLAVHTSTAGSAPRFRLSNAFGTQPVTFGRAYAGIRRPGTAATQGGNRPLTFAGSTSVTVAPGATVTSDPLTGLRLPAFADLLISVYVRSAAGPATGHGLAMQTSYIATGDHAADRDAAAFTGQTQSWYYLDAVTVDAPAGTGAVAVLGDSITDGWHTTGDRNNRWPDYLARRLAADRSARLTGVANEGISGNRVLADGGGQSALGRLDRDVLSLPGVRTVILLEGVNDIKAVPAPAADDLIAGYRQIIARTHRAGKCIVGATVLPFNGWSEWSPAGEAVRQRVNAFIRTPGAFDAMIDLDEQLRSPYDPSRLFPPFDSGDRLHPGDKGMQAMADTVDLPSLACHR
jgi:lysophospholipase L1-like esterase